MDRFELRMDRLENVEVTDTKTTARCPACAEEGHDNKGNHLFINADNRYGCIKHPGKAGKSHRKRIFELVGIKPESTAMNGKEKNVHKTLGDAERASVWGLEKASGHKWTPTRRDFYHDEHGNQVAAVIRLDRADGATDKNGKVIKEFRPVHRADNGWVVGDPPGLWPLFRLSEIKKDGPVYICEGEKAAAAGVSIGLNCTTTAHGAMSPHKTDLGPLAGRDVVFLPDHDASGRAYAEKLGALLAGSNPPARVKIVKLPGLPPAGDLADFVKLRPDGCDVAETIRRLADEASVEKPEPSAPPATNETSDTRNSGFPEQIQKLTQTYGPPFLVTPRGFAAQEPFWASLYAAERTLLHEPAERLFYQYSQESGLFLERTPEIIKTEIAMRILKASDEWRIPQLAASRGDKFLSYVVNHLRGQVEVRDAFTKKGAPFVHVANGVIVFHDGDADLVEFSPKFCSRSQLPVAFNPQASCNRFLDELILPAVHPEDVALMQKFAGLYLLGKNIIQRFLILDGMPNGGKGAFSSVLWNLLGPDNCTELRTDQLTGRFEIFRYLKKSFLYGADVDADFLNTKGARYIKALVGGDLLDPEGKNLRGSFQVEGHFNLLITSNIRLRVKLQGDVGAWRRRMTIVRYENPPPKRRIPDFGKLLVQTEGSGILNWALAGLRDLLQDVDKTGDIALTDRQLGIVDALLAESDSLRVFLVDCVEAFPGQTLTVREITETYAAYCPAKGWNPLHITTIHGQLDGLMLELFSVTKSHSCGAKSSERGFRGVRFKNEETI